MKRGNHTHYTYEEALIYEFNGYYFVIERCQQGKELLAAHGPRQVASENCGLSAKIRVDAGADAIGQAVALALSRFDVNHPEYDPWENKELGKLLCKWLGARSVSAIERESRLVQTYHRLEADSNYKYAAKTFVVVPFDNSTLNPWCGPMFDRAIVLSDSVDLSSLGAGVLQAFELATYNPNRKLA